MIKLADSVGVLVGLATIASSIVTGGVWLGMTAKTVDRLETDIKIEVAEINKLRAYARGMELRVLMLEDKIYYIETKIRESK